MGRHRGERRGAPVRTGLLGVSAAVAVGAIGVASGLLPGGETFSVGNAGKETPRVEAADRQAPSLTTQGGSSVSPADRSANPGGGTGAGKGTGKGAANGKAASPSAAPSPKPTPSKTVTAPPGPKHSTVTPAPKPEPKSEPVKTAAPTRAPATVAPASPSATVRSAAARERAAEAEVVRLVNLERARVGCVAVRPDAELAALAGAFSADMAARNFFDHTDPDGDSPWTRAQRAGVMNLGGENIARGQVDAAAVMTSWMASDGHRANILNCDYRTLGVGVSFADGGPWWTQDFGF
ncbi:CAP domain-containing protein [Streptomyces roseicoloratus]|uniref:CAP domain-containing protein n=1 Tax=Streptomyces roseicoloratus TaxID=2508722 RepID=UPI00100994F6|nr:CAP domain-containing protein [Streptomyces roseicoloratus]